MARDANPSYFGRPRGSTNDIPRSVLALLELDTTGTETAASLHTRSDSSGAQVQEIEQTSDDFHNHTRQDEHSDHTHRRLPIDADEDRRSPSLGTSDDTSEDGKDKDDSRQGESGLDKSQTPIATPAYQQLSDTVTGDAAPDSTPQQPSLHDEQDTPYKAEIKSKESDDTGAVRGDANEDNRVPLLTNSVPIDALEQSDDRPSRSSAITFTFADLNAAATAWQGQQARDRPTDATLSMSSSVGQAYLHAVGANFGASQTLPPGLQARMPRRKPVRATAPR